jgi:hypothetical protein
LRATAPADLELTGWCLAIPLEKVAQAGKVQGEDAEDQEADPAEPVALADPVAELAVLDDRLEAAVAAEAGCLAGAEG